MLRTRSLVRTLAPSDRDQALRLCARNPQSNVFVAARIAEGALVSHPGSALGIGEGTQLRSLCWGSTNVVPVECDDSDLRLLAERVKGWRRQCCSIFGPAEQVLSLWDSVRRDWGSARAVRRNQPLMACARPARRQRRDPGVRPARSSEVDLVVPAAAAMFTEEIGYPPYTGSPAWYRSTVAGLIARGRTFVRVEDGEVVFKADVGSLALGVAQIQGVWVSPRLRGTGLAAPAMAAVVDQVCSGMADCATLYVNDFNVPARRAYQRAGFTEVGMFATVLL